MTLGGIQAPPYAFFRNGRPESGSNITFWDAGKYSTPNGVSIIGHKGEGYSSWDTTAYDMILVNETRRFLDDHMKKRKDDPFFAYVALGNVHTPHAPPKKYFDGSTIAGYYPTDHMNVLREMDMVVGSLIGLLSERKLLNNTIVVFTSDNGGLVPNGSSKYSGQYNHSSSGILRGSKGQIYEGGHRVPLIMRWDGVIPAGETRPHLVGLNDLFATLCQLVGIKVPEGQAIDSISFANYARKSENSDNLRRYLGIWRMFRGKLQFESIRMDNLKLIRDRRNGNLELYDLDRDISETTNLFFNGTSEALVSKMLAQLKDISPCYDNHGTFKITKEDDAEVKVNCTWFQMPSKHCDLYAEGRKECRMTCAGRSKPICQGRNRTVLV
jgi:arylsulfatase A-like enzyme